MNPPLQTAYRGRLIGVEVEFFVVDLETLEPRDCVETLSAHSAFGVHVKPEAVREQIEVCTGAFTALAEMEAQLRGFCAELSTLLSSVGAALLPLALVESEHLTWSDSPRVQRLRQRLGAPFAQHAGSIAADQINLGANDVEDALRIFNRIRNFTGDFVALGAASPMRHGAENGIACNRLDIYDATLGLADHVGGLPPLLQSVEDLQKFIATRSLFGDSGSSYGYLRPRPERGVSVELRCVDKQPTLARTMGLAALAKAIMLSEIEPRDVPQLSANCLTQARRAGIVQHDATRALIAQLAQFLPFGRAEISDFPDASERSGARRADVAGYQRSPSPNRPLLARGKSRRLRGRPLRSVPFVRPRCYYRLENPGSPR